MKRIRKVNPQRQSATMADLKKAKTIAQNEAIKAAMAIFFTVLMDKEHATPEILQRVWREVNELSESVVEGYVKISDLLHTLKAESGVEIT